MDDGSRFDEPGVVLDVLPDEQAFRQPLRADLGNEVVVVQPGQPVEVSLQVLNTSSVIETLQVRLLGLIAETVAIEPAELTLFPEEATEVKVVLTFHESLPAGEHEGLLVVSGTSGHAAPAEVPLRVEVPAAPAASVCAEPPLKSGGRKGRFELLITNDGNTDLTLQVRAADADRQLSLEIDQPTVHLTPDGSEGVNIVARGRRPWTGAPVDHAITIDVIGREIAHTEQVTFRQKARLTAGIITLLTLALIVTLWALAMVFGVSAALAPSPPTKMVPAAFAEGIGLEDLDPTVVGGSLTGTIAAASTAGPLSRATVEAFDQRGRLVGATATGDDGSFTLDGLLPVRHRLRIRAVGFEEIWWPSAASSSAATPLLVTPDEPMPGIDARLVGAPGALGGQVVAGDGEVIPIAVEVQALDLLNGPTVSRTTADAQGVWSIGGLTAPATYRITYRAEGYAPVEITQPLAGGESLAVNTTRLPAAAGSITGLVVDRDGVSLGGVEILAQRGTTELGFTTPTSGQIGSFTLEDLETPGTYLLSFVADGFAPETRAVRLGPGEALDQLEVVLGPATGLVTGRVLGPAGQAIGGVTVTVSGGGTVLSTDTLTSGDIGSFRLSGLPLPGIYAVTFDVAGFARETVRVELGRETPTARAEVTLTSTLGTLTGSVVDAVTGAPLAAVVVEVSDGVTVRSATTATLPLDQRGTFSVAELPPGTYTVTARVPGRDPVTVLRTVTAATSQQVVIRVGAPS